MADDPTPLMRQYWELKSQVPGALLLFRMGDFYELFSDDAVEAAKILEITLTSRDKGKENALPMAGVPHHSVQGYIQRLLAQGKTVAIGEQTEHPAEAKKRGGAKAIVRREITRVFTPAVQFDSEGAQTTYLATAIPVESGDSKSTPPRFTLACLDPSTGEDDGPMQLDGGRQSGDLPGGMGCGLSEPRGSPRRGMRCVRSFTGLITTGEAAVAVRGP